MVFAAQAIRQAKKYTKESSEKTTILLSSAGYTEDQISQIKASADKYGVEVIQISDAKQVVNYVNSHDICAGEVSNTRSADPVTNVDFFSHGLVNKIELGFELDKPSASSLVFNKAIASNLDPSAFSCDAVVTSFACRTGQGNEKIGELALPWENFDLDNSLAQNIANSGQVTVKAYISRTDYSGTFGSSDDRNLLKNGFGGYWPGDYSFTQEKLNAFKNYQSNIINNNDGTIWHSDGAFNEVQGGTTPKGTPNNVQIYEPKK